MPELPEVEVVKRSLKKKIENLVIKKVKINDTNLRYKLDKREISKLIGKKIKKIDRRSKLNHHIFHFSNPILKTVRNKSLKIMLKNNIFLNNYIGKIYN